MRETYLFTPGPLSLSTEVKDAMKVDLGSRDEVFKQITQRVRERLLLLSSGWQSHAAIPIQGSGTFALEAACATFLSGDDRALVCVNGLYGERIASILERIEVQCQVARFSDLTPIDPFIVESTIRRDGRFTHLCFVHCETTTGLMNPMRDLLKVGRTHGLVTLIDAMSSFGGVPLSDEISDIDILVSSGNKCIEAPAGIAFAIVSNRLLSGRSHARTFCLDMLDQWRNFEEKREWRTTPPTHVVQAVDKALASLVEEGIPARNTRYTRVKEKLLDGMTALGFQTAIKPEHQSPICLAFRSAELVPDAQTFLSYYAALARAGVFIYAKLHEPTTTFRIGCIGQIQDSSIERLLSTTARHFRLPASLIVA